MEGIINSIIDGFSGFMSLKYGKEIIVFIISLLPILELRGGLLASSFLGLNPVSGYIVSIIGNVLPVPLILLFINKVLDMMEKSNINWMKKFARWLDKKARKHQDKIEKYGYLGLILFVGIPLPGTGAWTGCLVSSVLNMNKKKSFFAILAGIIMASIIMMFISYGILGKIIK